MHEQDKAISEEQGERAGVARACSNLGCYFSTTGDYARAVEMHEQCKAIFEEIGDRVGVGAACSGLGNCYRSMGDYGRAREWHEQHKAIAGALGDRAGVAKACANLGNCYYHTGDYARAIEMHEQRRAMAEELGDRAGVAGACGNLGMIYERTGDYMRALQMHEQDRALAEALGDRAGLAGACGNLGHCYCGIGEHMKAISYFQTQFVISEELGLEDNQAKAALDMGAVMVLHIRADRQAAAASQALSPAAHLPGPLPSASALDALVTQAATWLKAALSAGYGPASLHLAHLACDAGHEDIALNHLKDYLSSCVKRGRNWCDGCNQKRGEDAPMLTCSGCRVARFCSADHQKMASKSVASGGSLRTGRHKDICELLGKWRSVEKDGVSPDSLRTDLLAFLRQPR